MKKLLFYLTIPLLILSSCMSQQSVEDEIKSYLSENGGYKQLEPVDVTTYIFLTNSNEVKVIKYCGCGGDMEIEPLFKVEPDVRYTEPCADDNMDFNDTFNRNIYHFDGLGQYKNDDTFSYTIAVKGIITKEKETEIKYNISYIIKHISKEFYSYDKDDCLDKINSQINDILKENNLTMFDFSYVKTLG